MISVDPTRPRRIELILRQIESLPTLPAVAARLLELTTSDDSHARQVIELISSDAALTAKVLRMCRTADKGLREQVLSVDKAVVLLGFNAIRNTVLSVKVFEMFSAAAPPPPEDRAAGEQDGEGKAFDRSSFWLHSLAVGVLAERIAKAHKGRRDLHRDEAFVCGLLHDIGKLALDYVLPRSFSRVIELTEFNQGNIAEFERKIVGLDHHTVGKRLAEQWHLPHRLQDCIWLHGATYDTLPRLEHRNLVALIELADILVRRQHIGYSGNFKFNQDPSFLIERLNLDARIVEEAVASLHSDVDERAGALGLRDVPTPAMFLQSIQRANEELGRINGVLERRGRMAQQQSRVLDAITTFHSSAMPGRSVQDVLEAVIESARGVLGNGYYAMLVPGMEIDEVDGPWLICQYNREGHAVHAQYVDPPPMAPKWNELGGDSPDAGGAVSLMSILPWLADYLMEADDLRQVRLLPLSCGWGTAGVLLHDRQDLPPWVMLHTLCASWGAAIAAAQQHEGARRLGEQLAEANTQLAEAQDRLLRQESLAHLGQMAAGAAHEMNNPLAVISGRSQLLMMGLNQRSKEYKAARTIHEESHRLSDLITALHMFADPPRARRQSVDLSKLLDEVIRQVRQEWTPEKHNTSITLRINHPLGDVDVDPQMVSRAVEELLTNAMQARPRSEVLVQALRDPEDHAVLIRVADDGAGMDKRTLDHAFDPFFSALPAGRRVGMGLPRAQQLAAAHGGSVQLISTLSQGTTATLRLPAQKA